LRQLKLSPVGRVSKMHRTGTNERIVIDMLVGALGAVAMALASGTSSFDSLVAAFLRS
jgi:hypothetical protein